LGKNFNGASKGKWCLHQGDQIGRIFACWAVVFFEENVKITVVARIFGLFFHGAN
jgi:hypothetical protein